MWDQADATAHLKAVLNNTAYTTVTATHIRLGTTTPTATVAMTQLTGSGYTAGGSAISWNTVVAAATTNSSSVSWTNGSGGTWNIVGLEIWDTAGTPLRHLFGTWTGQPVSVANGNVFQVAASAIAASMA